MIRPTRPNQQPLLSSVPAHGLMLASHLGTAKLMRQPYIRTTMNIYGDAATEDMRRATARPSDWYYEVCKTSEANCKNGFVPTLKLSKDTWRREWDSIIVNFAISRHLRNINRKLF